MNSLLSTSTSLARQSQVRNTASRRTLSHNTSSAKPAPRERCGPTAHNEIDKKISLTDSVIHMRDTIAEPSAFTACTLRRRAPVRWCKTRALVIARLQDPALGGSSAERGNTLARVRDMSPLQAVISAHAETAVRITAANQFGAGRVPALPGPINAANFEMHRERRMISNADLMTRPYFEQAMTQLGMGSSDMFNVFAKIHPAGFEDEYQFVRFADEVMDACRADGIGDASIRLKGTSTTFFSENARKSDAHHWDRQAACPGDYDLALFSPTLVDEASSNGLQANKKFGFYNYTDIVASYLALEQTLKRWTRILGRDVNMVFLKTPEPFSGTDFQLENLQRPVSEMMGAPMPRRLQARQKKGTFVGMQLDRASRDTVRKYIKANRIPGAMAADRLHTTLMYSRTELKGYADASKPKEPAAATVKKVEKWDTPGGKVLVAKLDAPALTERHQFLMQRYSGSYDHAQFQPHVTLSRDADGVNLSKLAPLTTTLTLEGEYHKDIGLDTV